MKKASQCIIMLIFTSILSVLTLACGSTTNTKYTSIDQAIQNTNDEDPVLIKTDPLDDYAIDKSIFGIKTISTSFNLTPKQIVSIYNKFESSQWDPAVWSKAPNTKHDWTILNTEKGNDSHGDIYSIFQSKYNIYYNNNGAYCITMNRIRPFELKYSLVDFMEFGFIFHDIKNDKRLLEKFYKSCELITEYRKTIKSKYNLQDDFGRAATTFVHNGIRIGIFFDESPNASATIAFISAR